MNEEGLAPWVYFHCASGETHLLRATAAAAAKIARLAYRARAAEYRSISLEETHVHTSVSVSVCIHTCINTHLCTVLESGLLYKKVARAPV